MVASTLRYEQRGKAQETKSGVSVYDGIPSGFFEWKFRTLARYHSTEKTELWKLGSWLVEGLAGEALKVAMGMGHKKLNEETAVPVLVDKVKKHTHIFPLASAEARELYKMGQRPGVFSRQGDQLCRAQKAMVGHVAKAGSKDRPLRDLAGRALGFRCGS